MGSELEIVWASLLASAPQAILTTGVGGATLFAYRNWSTSGPRRAFLKKMRSNLWATVEVIDIFSRESKDSRKKNLELLAAWFRAIGRQCKNNQFFVDANHQIFLSDLAASAEIRAESLIRDRDIIVEKGLLGHTHTSARLEGATERNFRVYFITMPFEHYLLEVLYRLNKFLKKYSKGLNYDFTKKIRNDQRRDLIRQWDKGDVVVLASQEFNEAKFRFESDQDTRMSGREMDYTPNR